jgi:hypothetical protein
VPAGAVPILPSRAAAIVIAVEPPKRRFAPLGQNLESGMKRLGFIAAAVAALIVGAVVGYRLMGTRDKT